MKGPSLFPALSPKPLPSWHDIPVEESVQTNQIHKELQNIYISSDEFYEEK